MDLRKLSDLELLNSLDRQVLSEREKMMCVLEHLREVDRRRLYADFNCDSLWAFCVKKLKYSSGSAGRRVRAMRLLKELPELKEDLLEGKQNLTSLSQAHNFFRTEEKVQEKKLSSDEKRNVLERLEDRSTRDCELELLNLSSAPIELSNPERVRALDEKHTELRLVVGEELFEKLNQIKALRSHANPAMGYAELLEYMADEILKKIDPTQKESSPQNETPQQNTIPLAIKREVWKRADGRCAYIDSTGERCNSPYFLEIDHHWPRALGGENSPDNLRLLCRAHNQRAAVKLFGARRE